MRIRKMMNDDIDFALSLTSIEGWSDIRSDFEALISYSPTAAFVLEDSDDYIGMISAISYGVFGFIGNLIVHPLYRGQGYGIQLLRYGIKQLQDLGTPYFMLDAVPEALSLYEKHGFRPVCKSYRLRGKISELDSENVREISEEDLPTIYEIDKEYFGADRSHFLRNKWMGSPNLCVCLEQEGNIVSYAMGSHRDEYVRVAPWVVTVHGDFNGDLLRAIGHFSGGRELAMGILETSTRAYDLALSNGLALGEYSHSIRMVKGNILPTFSPNQYAIGAPSTG
ncbi:MAG: GNAT family N-acetyltransferase [Candidatus Thorarchaeota archaeon]